MLVIGALPNSCLRGVSQAPNHIFYLIMDGCFQAHHQSVVLLPRDFAAIVFILVIAAAELRVRYFLQHLLEFPPLLRRAVCKILRIFLQAVHIATLF